MSDGSSPLTRGKPDLREVGGTLARLIPAHAGKTATCTSWTTRNTAHPRSRGENRSGGMPRAATSGSSPLTRGKRSIREDERTMTGLIPAHAGKTCPHRSRRPIHRAHPRSRGENYSELGNTPSMTGSSPLTRGKQRRTRVGVIRPRLIPAHAGKTFAAALPRPLATAHPRSRGENGGRVGGDARRGGSSPLTRGKLLTRKLGVGLGRLIPAHAGKTTDQATPRNTDRAHPRSRGENTRWRRCSARAAGSSPLTRGKPCSGGVNTETWGLIPAHAGKTACAVTRLRALSAHPRSRGENRVTQRFGVL